MSNLEDTKEVGKAKGRDEKERKSNELGERERTDLPGRAGEDKVPIYGNHEALSGKERADKEGESEEENEDLPTPNGFQMP